MRRSPPRLRASLLAFAIACAAAIPAQAREVRCTVYSGNRLALDNVCEFAPDGRDGSFVLSAARNGKQVIPGISMISVTVVSPGVAEVRGLTKDGINSRWGEARRSQDNRACWKGADFQVCAK